MATFTTTYHGPTSCNGSRIGVRGYSERQGKFTYRVFPFDYAASDPHDSAVLAFCREEGVPGGIRLVRGEHALDSRGWVYADADANHSITTGEG